MYALISCTERTRMQEITSFAHNYLYFISKKSRIKNIGPQPSVFSQGNDLTGQASCSFFFFLYFPFFSLETEEFYFPWLTQTLFILQGRKNIHILFSWYITYIVLCDGVTEDYYNTHTEDNSLIVVGFSLALAFLDIWVVHHVNLILREHRFFGI